MRSRKQSCTRKRRYATRGNAWNSIRALISRGAWGFDLHPYECRFCGGYHVGHRNGSGGKRP